MFFDKLTEDDFLQALDSNLKKQYAFEDDLDSQRRQQLNTYLTTAAQSLQQAGLIKEAQLVIELCDTCQDPAMLNLTSEQQLENLANKGWVFNADDLCDVCQSEDCQCPGQCNCQQEDCSTCSSGEMQLSQAELRQLRQILKNL